MTLSNKPKPLRTTPTKNHCSSTTTPVERPSKSRPKTPSPTPQTPYIHHHNWPKNRSSDLCQPRTNCTISTKLKTSPETRPPTSRISHTSPVDPAPVIYPSLQSRTPITSLSRSREPTQPSELDQYVFKANPNFIVAPI